MVSFVDLLLFCRADRLMVSRGVSDMRGISWLAMLDDSMLSIHCCCYKGHDLKKKEPHRRYRPRHTIISITIVVAIIAIAHRSK